MYTIYATDTFKKVYSSLDKNERIWIDNLKNEQQKIIDFIKEHMTELLNHLKNI